MRSKFAARTAGVFGVLLAGCVRLASAQEELPMLALVAGPMRYALRDRSTGSLFALRLASPLVPLGTRHWLLEWGESYGEYPTDSGEHRHALVSEAQLQTRSGGTQPVQIFAGIGGGVVINREDSTTSHPRRSLPLNLTLSAGAGARLLIAENWGVVGEFRLRRITSFRGWTRELTVGLLLTL